MSIVIEFHVIGDERLHCAACEARIGSALLRLPGVRNVQARARSQQISVTLDSTQVSHEQVRAAAATRIPGRAIRRVGDFR